MPKIRVGIEGLEEAEDGAVKFAGVERLIVSVTVSGRPLRSSQGAVFPNGDRYGNQSHE